MAELHSQYTSGNQFPAGAISGSVLGVSGLNPIVDRLNSITQSNNLVSGASTNVYGRNIQSGEGTTDASGNLTVTFDTPFTATPAVVGTAQAQDVVVSITTLGTGSVVFHAGTINTSVTIGNESSHTHGDGTLACASHDHSFSDSDSDTSSGPSATTTYELLQDGECTVFVSCTDCCDAGASTCNDYDNVDVPTDSHTHSVTINISGTTGAEAPDVTGTTGTGSAHNHTGTASMSNSGTTKISWIAIGAT